jgi:protein CpxP
MKRVLNSKVLVFTIVILLLANIFLLVFFLGKKPPERRPHNGSPVAAFLEKDLAFNANQMEAYEKMRQQHRQTGKPFFEDLRLTKVRFYKLLSNATVSESVVDSMATLIGEKQKAIDLRAFRNFKEIRSLCNASQQPLYDSLIPQVIGKMWFTPRKGNGRPGKDSTNVKK